MVPDPTHIALPYVLSSVFLEHEALRGHFPQRNQLAELVVAELSDGDAERVLAIRAALAWLGSDRSPLVLDTGLDDAAVTADDGSVERLVNTIHQEIGVLPTLNQIVAGSPAELLDEYERWIRRYRELAPRALQEWVARWAQDEPVTIPQLKRGINPFSWRVPIAVLVRTDGREEQFLVEGRADFNLFRRARAATVRRRVAKAAVGSGSWAKALEIVEPRVWVHTSHDPVKRVVTDFEHVTERLTRVALAHHHQKLVADRRFADDMAAWADRSGSEQLKMGLADGYRMTSIYLDERIAREAPGFYATRTTSTKLLGKPRTGPSEAALRLRRAVQARLDDNATSGPERYDAVIRWVSCEEVPAALLDDDDHHAEDEEIEAIVIGGWLGRYQLIGLVEPDGGRPWWVRRTLDPNAYGLGAPPSAPAPADDDIPF